jgi:pimeloyl-ACP methyl ester carboxylesterase
VATFLADRHPELVRSLTLVSPAVRDLRPVHDRGADARLALIMLPGIAAEAERRLAGISPENRARGLAYLCFGEPEKLQADDLAAAEAEFRWRSGLPWAHSSMVSSLRALIRAQLRPYPWSFSSAAHHVRIPTLIVWGTRDRLVDVRLARRTAENFLDARLLVLAGAGHVAQMERPAETARAMMAMWAATPGAPRPTAGRTVARWRP